ncbi:hypothetical protein NL317_28490, partial [Klebsiella pneumoniae]|nr:hypothetical protein [Klebsiella pneumoniae]
TSHDRSAGGVPCSVSAVKKIDDEFSILELISERLRIEVQRSDESNSVYISLKLYREKLYGYEWEEINGEWITIPDPQDFRS